MGIFSSRAIPASTEIEIDGVLTEIAVRQRANAKHYRLTIGRDGQPVLSLPPNGRWREAEAFLLRQKGWLGARLSRVPQRVGFVAGAEIPLRGMPHLIADSGRIRGRVEMADGEPPQLLVPGGEAHMARRLKDFLKAEAKADLEKSVFIHAARLDVKPVSITLKDQSTRWGSCSSRGRLNFNWRLILAPEFVLDYVAAHEVAHMVEMNHSPAFWATVERTLPDMARGRAWLKAHGRELMVYG